MSEAEFTAQVEYRPIPGFPGYQIGSDGSVLSEWSRGHDVRRTGNWRRMKVQLRHGYCGVGLYRDGKRKTRLVHVLVLESFVGPCPVGMETAHHNGLRDDNRLGNLAWKTKLENAADKIRHGTVSKGSRNGQSKLNESAVLEIRAAAMNGEPATVLKQRYGVTYETIRQVINRKFWQHV